MAKEKPDGATAEQLAQLFDCTPRQIQLWAQDGICVRVGHGRYNAAESTRNVVRHLREQAAGRAGVDRDTDVVAANKERSMEQAALHRAKRLQLEGKLIPVDEVREMWGRIVRGLRQALLAYPGAMAFELPMLTPHDVNLMKRRMNELLTDASLGKHVDGGNDVSESADLSESEARGRDAAPAGAAAAALAG